MNNEKSNPVATAGMLIRRPVGEVFEAFTDPAITSRFWFSEGSGRLEPGASVEWRWKWYGATGQVIVRAIEQDRRILMDWGDPGEMSTVEWLFEERADGSTFVSIENWGFAGDADAKAAQAIDSAGGFALVLAGAKAWLEHGIELGLVPDRHPYAWVEGER